MYDPQDVNYLENVIELANDLRPRDKVWLARYLLDDIQEFEYSEFESAQAVERYVKKARNALRGLSLV